MPRLIYLYGGTFDPVHYGHLKPLDELQQKLTADAVYILPASIPPHRPVPQASCQQRVEMLKLALREYPDFILDCRELEREGPSWTVLTLQSFQQQYPADNLCLVMGSDAFASLPTWYHWKEILQLAHIIVIQRAGELACSMPDWATEHMVDDVTALRNRKCSSVMPVSLKGYDISATDIRQRLNEGRDIDGMLSDEVIDFIRQNGLYQNDK
ncbi:nicotinate-nucleotide adenylyltransferase [bacterium BMS3Abin11]|nr:nicotinate-nucleotide adenylyltransferase [bacterium BMS3Abin11]GMT41273.1 MAG: putative nicotinate-nucleotide adenylyltransferase [bacterium]